MQHNVDFQEMCCPILHLQGSERGQFTQSHYLYRRKCV